MFNQHKIFRVLKLITLLQNKPAKSIRFISNLLDCTERTTYRYLDLLKQVGFDITKDEHNKFYMLSDSNQATVPFTNEEASFLIELVKTTAKEHALHDSILKKIYLKSEVSNQAKSLFNAHLSKLVEKINGAISNNKKVMLLDYHSVNSNKISNRLIEPILFTENYNAICAFEVDSQLNKRFNLERMIDVVVLEEPQEFHAKHVVEQTDVFGFTERDGKKFQVELVLTLRAYILFKEMNPGLIKYITHIPDTTKYLLCVNVNNTKPILSLINGFKDDVIVKGSNEFISYCGSKNINI